MQEEKERLDRRVVDATEPMIEVADPAKQVPEEEVVPEVVEEPMEGDDQVRKLVEDKIAKIEMETELIRAIRDAAESPDVSEVYSPPRVTTTATSMGLKAGEAMDLLTGWDFTLKRHRDAALAYVKRARPSLLIGSPECTMFSMLQKSPCRL